MRKLLRHLLPLLLALGAASQAQVNVAIMPVPSQQFLDANGNPYSGGKLYTYTTGTSTPLASYTSSTGLNTLPNPAILDSAGRCCSSNSAGGMWLGPATYRIILKTSADVQVWAIDGIRGNNLFSLSNVLLTESTAPTCAAGSDILWADSTGHRFKMCNNGGAADTVIGAATTDTLTNKTLTSPTITTPTVTGGTFSGSPSFTGTPAFSGNPTFTGNPAFTGAPTFKKINNVFYADQYTGATADVKLNAANADCVTAGGGIIDARGFGATSPVIAAQVTIGDATTGAACTLLIDKATNFSITATGTVDAIKLVDSAIIALGAEQPASRANFTASSTAVLRSVINAVGIPANGNAPFVGLDGVNVQGNAAATVSVGMIVLDGITNVSELHNTNVYGFYNTTGIVIRNNVAAVGPLNLANVTADGGGNTGACPVLIQSNTTSVMSGISFFGGSLTHPGSACAAIVNIAGDGSHLVEVGFYGTQLESWNLTDIGILVNAATGVHMQDVSFTAHVNAGTDCIKIVSTGGAVYNIVADNITNFNAWTNTLHDVTNTVSITDARISHYTYLPPGTAINDWYGTGGFIARVNNSGFTFTKPTLYTEGTPAGAVAGSDVCQGDSTAHTLKCSYNNGAFYSQTQTIGTGNVTTAGSAVNTGTCQAQTGITVTGAAVTDNVLANIGAALPATWQTGIVLSAHVTAAATVTVYLCNPTAGNITPAATAVNVRVVR